MSASINRILSQNVVDKSTGELMEGVQIIPPGRLIELAQYIAENLLPRIEKRLGRDHQEYENMLLAVNAILYCLTLLDKWEASERKYRQQIVYSRAMQKINADLESELSKYEAIEQVVANGTVDMYQQVFRKKGLDLIQDLLRQYGMKE